MTILEKIVADRRARVAAAKQRTSLAQCRAAALAAPRQKRSLLKALRGDGVRIIAEIKRASPSRGEIDINLDPARVARNYAAGGAAALSVLTEGDYFRGSPEDLRQARQAASLPVLRKDFIIDPWQIYESVLMGADAVLLIVRILPAPLFAELHALALGLGLDVLTEVFDSADVAQANDAGANLVGINNRDLASFKTDAAHAGRLAGIIRPGAMVVALSGIVTDDDVRRTLAAGISRFLVGEALVRAPDPVSVLKRWSSMHGG